VVTPTRGNDNYKYICKQYQSTKIHKANINRYKERDRYKQSKIETFILSFQAVDWSQQS
jgi:hypothetical protein